MAADFDGSDRFHIGVHIIRAGGDWVLLDASVRGRIRRDDVTAEALRRLNSAWVLADLERANAYLFEPNLDRRLFVPRVDVGVQTVPARCLDLRDDAALVFARQDLA